MLIPVIDLFAGPGGLAEGFSTATRDGVPSFKVKLSIEKDSTAHRTLELRSFYRQFPAGKVHADYFRYLRGSLSREALFERHPAEAMQARAEAWCATLGAEPATEVHRRIAGAIDGTDPWVLIGGPPCQAYSLVGRSRMKGFGTQFEKDPRHFLYLEYLQIIGDHWPAVFVIENVKGILSSKVKDAFIFDQIQADLRAPSSALADSKRKRRSTGRTYTYELVALTARSRAVDGRYESSDFIIRAENHGIPQARHRVIIVGVRSDWARRLPSMHMQLRTSAPVPVRDALADLPPVRSGVSHGEDSVSVWKATLASALDCPWFRECSPALQDKIRSAVTAAGTRNWIYDRGAEFISGKTQASNALVEEIRSTKLGGVCNHTARSHIPGDIYRYLFAAAFTQLNGHSPKIADFRPELRPKHANVNEAADGKMFADRFRVQRADDPSTTVTSHISKDGHYFIHPDPVQARSLTVREAARLQTFPDDYLFEGPRTAQYHQVGNAVPPLLARQIAAVLANAFCSATAG